MHLEPKDDVEFSKKKKKGKIKGEVKLSRRVRRKGGFFKIPEKKVNYESWLQCNESWNESTAEVLG